MLDNTITNIGGASRIRWSGAERKSWSDAGVAERRSGAILRLERPSSAIAAIDHAEGFGLPIMDCSSRTESRERWSMGGACHGTKFHRSRRLEGRNEHGARLQGYRTLWSSEREPKRLMRTLRRRNPYSTNGEHARINTLVRLRCPGRTL
ncbi:hypothetical protein NliqN6_1402 [Naganishia liquefaciens]|uniref:Uncharacterized protein n=1 Tax=Naganishia liquefaciens TaxID=104408 RepID=A0A8H3YD42_9TREE|nr:hypothetical protein NliqN6_1402 [Naganishia liquefaciens]